MWQKMVNFLKHAFSMEKEEITEEDERLLEKIADWLHKRRLAAPALLFGEVGMPLSFLGSQILVFLRPFAEMLFDPSQYGRIAKLLENRKALTKLLALLEERISGKSG